MQRLYKGKYINKSCGVLANCVSTGSTTVWEVLKVANRRVSSKEKISRLIRESAKMKIYSENKNLFNKIMRKIK